MSLTNSSPFEIAGAAAASARHLAVLSAKERNDALTAIHSALSSQKEVILAANAMDVELAKKAAADGTLSQSVLKRLDLARPGKWEDMLQGILDVRELEDPGMRGRMWFLEGETEVWDDRFPDGFPPQSPRSFFNLE